MTLTTAISAPLTPLASRTEVHTEPRFCSAVQMVPGPSSYKSDLWFCLHPPQPSIKTFQTTRTLNHSQHVPRKCTFLRAHWWGICWRYPKVRQWKVSNDGAFDTNIWAIAGPGIPYPLSPEVVAGATVTFDLTKVRGLKNGNLVSPFIFQRCVPYTNSAGSFKPELSLV